jgi:hypothetical protein
MTSEDIATAEDAHAGKDTDGERMRASNEAYFACIAAAECGSIAEGRSVECDDLHLEAIRRDCEPDA